MSETTFERPVLVLFAHPAMEKSRVQRGLASAIQDRSGITFHDLYETYPDFDIDVPREQRLLESHGVVVFQHPFFWYSTPSILKEWQDLVLEHGWAYGRGGVALRGKLWLSAISTGGGEEAYGPEGLNRFTIRQLLAPLEQTARLCGMEFLPPFVVHGTHRLPPDELERHAADYRAVLEGLRDGRIDLAAARNLPRINADVASILRR